MSRDLDVAIVGAGPYGLAVAAHLPHRRTAVFGRPLQTWRTLMPADMQLRAAWDDMTLTTPIPGRGDLADWLRRTGRERVEPMRVEDFVAYVDWYRREFVEAVVESNVARVEDTDSGFRLETEDGETFTAHSLVLAVGVTPFARVPAPFPAPEPGRVELAVERTSYDDLEGRSVAVVGAGQTAVEAAATALRDGARVELLARSRLVWFADKEPHHPRSPLARHLYDLAYPTVGYGPPPLNRLVLHPDLFARLPAALRSRITRRLLRPGGSPWLRSQVEGRAAVTEGVTIDRVARDDGPLRLALSDGTTRSVDLVLLAAGYRFQLERLDYLDDGIRRRIRVEDGWPVLDRDFRSTHPCVHFVGYAAEGLFGPSARFVLGAPFAAARVARAIG
jgi:cation diffusion facilitator CzcD-associated flavoprotein CzcO